MLNLLSGLFKASTSPPGAHKRDALTPGHLYRLMSLEFREFRSRHCSCVMPLVFTRARQHEEDCNWGVRDLATNCPWCQPLVDEIVARHTAVYDVNDPTYQPPPGESEDPSAHFPLFS